MKIDLIFRGGCWLENLATTNNERKPDASVKDYAVALLSRDYKGLSNYPSNGVLEIYEIKDE